MCTNERTIVVSATTVSPSCWIAPWAVQYGPMWMTSSCTHFTSKNAPTDWIKSATNSENWWDKGCSAKSKHRNESYSQHKHPRVRGRVTIVHSRPYSCKNSYIEEHFSEATTKLLSENGAGEISGWLTITSNKRTEQETKEIAPASATNYVI